MSPKRFRTVRDRKEQHVHHHQSPVPGTGTRVTRHRRCRRHPGGVEGPGRARPPSPRPDRSRRSLPIRVVRSVRVCPIRSRLAPRRVVPMLRRPPNGRVRRWQGSRSTRAGSIRVVRSARACPIRSRLALRPVVPMSRRLSNGPARLVLRSMPAWSIRVTRWVRVCPIRSRPALGRAVPTLLRLRAGPHRRSMTGWTTIPSSRLASATPPPTPRSPSTGTATAPGSDRPPPSSPLCRHRPRSHGSGPRQFTDDIAAGVLGSHGRNSGKHRA